MRGALRFAVDYFDDVNEIAEVGVQIAYNALRMYWALHPKKIHLIDRYKIYTPEESCVGGDTDKATVERPWKQFECSSWKEIAITNMDGLDHEFYFMESREASLSAPNELDMVYIDAGHTECDVAIDIACWWPKVRIGGIISGHDYNWIDVRNVTESFFGNIEHDDEDWWVLKKSRVYSGQKL